MGLWRSWHGRICDSVVYSEIPFRWKVFVARSLDNFTGDWSKAPDSSNHWRPVRPVGLAPNCFHAGTRQPSGISHVGAYYQEISPSLDWSLFFFFFLFVLFVFFIWGRVSRASTGPKSAYVPWDYRCALPSPFMYLCSQHLEWRTCSSADPWRPQKARSSMAMLSVDLRERRASSVSWETGRRCWVLSLLLSSIQPFPQATLDSG